MKPSWVKMVKMSLHKAGETTQWKGHSSCMWIIQVQSPVLPTIWSPSSTRHDSQAQNEE